MRIILLLVLASLTTFGQETRYFSAYFQTMGTEKTDCKRKYFFQEDETLIEDYENEKIQHKAVIVGLSKIDEVNAFAWYCISRGVEIHYRDYFEDAKAAFDFYHNDSLTTRLVVHGSKVKYAQVWDEKNLPILTNGSGQNVYVSTELEEEIHEHYKDSTLLIKYGIRINQKDTIYYTYDKIASPKSGIENFYQDLVKVLKYPGIARLVGKEGRIYVQFVVNEDGKLTDFKPLTNEGYRFEARTVKRLEEFPNWSPALLKNRPVKTSFILPVKFQLTN